MSEQKSTSRGRTFLAGRVISNYGQSSIDCIVRFRTRVTETGLLEAKQLDAIDKEVDGHIAGALAKAKAAPYPKPEALFTDVYATY